MLSPHERPIVFLNGSEAEIALLTVGNTKVYSCMLFIPQKQSVNFHFLVCSPVIQKKHPDVTRASSHDLAIKKSVAYAPTSFPADVFRRIGRNFKGQRNGHISFV